ncbi:hypothetical protein ACFWHV_01680 [Streptomyces collinus]
MPSLPCGHEGLGRQEGWESRTDAKVRAPADIVVPAAHCEILYEIPVNR